MRGEQGVTSYVMLDVIIPVAAAGGDILVTLLAVIAKVNLAVDTTPLCVLVLALRTLELPNAHLLKQPSGACVRVPSYNLYAWLRRGA